MEDPNLRRRAVATMVLYVSVVLMGAIAAIPVSDLEDDVVVAAAIWGSALGLALAHWFAFNAAAHLFRGEGIAPEDLREGFWELVAALGVAVVATVPLLLLDETTTGAAVSLFALAAVVTAVAYVASRHGGLSRPRALLRGAVTLVLAVIVAVVKIWIDH